jgi:hypothetical protein
MLFLREVEMKIRPKGHWQPINLIQSFQRSIEIPKISLFSLGCWKPQKLPTSFQGKLEFLKLMGWLKHGWQKKHKKNSSKGNKGNKKKGGTFHASKG